MTHVKQSDAMWYKTRLFTQSAAVLAEPVSWLSSTTFTTMLENLTNTRLVLGRSMLTLLLIQPSIVCHTDTTNRILNQKKAGTPPLTECGNLFYSFIAFVKFTINSTCTDFQFRIILAYAFVSPVPFN